LLQPLANGLGWYYPLMNQELITITKAAPADLPEILVLLRAANLPHEGVSEHLDNFLVARANADRIVGCIGLEHYGELGLLRSAAVASTYRGQGIGGRLTQALTDLAAQAGIREIVLLTTTAKAYFQTKFDFVEIPRTAYAARLAASPEWNLPRCSSAAFMRRLITKG
jgi:amino-acid N-acetyltransferase